MGAAGKPGRDSALCTKTSGTGSGHAAPSTSAVAALQATPFNCSTCSLKCMAASQPHPQKPEGPYPDSYPKKGKKGDIPDFRRIPEYRLFTLPFYPSQSSRIWTAAYAVRSPRPFHPSTALFL